MDRKSRDIAPARLTKTLSAFANADGGELSIGIEDDGRWRGFATPEDANGHIQALESLFPLGGDVHYEFLAADGEHGIVLHVVVLKTQGIKAASDGVAYLRRGAQNLPVDSPEGLERLRRDKGITSFESVTLNFDLDEVTNSETVIGFMLNVVPDAEPQPWLKKQRLIVDDKATVAGTVLFHDEPQIHLPKAAIKIYRYATDALEGTRETLAFDPITIEGSLYDVIKSAVERTAQEVEQISIYTPEGLRQVEYPHETLHEIITNGVLHRDYSHNDDVHVRIFDNRVEVESPGRLPGHVTPRNILTERFARNPGIVRLINKFPDPPNKDVGEGLNTAFAAMQRLQLQPPQIVERENSVLVLIRHERLASPESRIVQYLEEEETITNAEARELTGIESEGQIRRVFNRLIEAAEIERVPGTQRGGAKYRRTPH